LGGEWRGSSWWKRSSLVWPAWWEARELVIEKDGERERKTTHEGLKRMKEVKRKLVN